MKGAKQDKREEYEWIERGKDLAEITTLFKAWRHMLPEEFVERIEPILTRYSERSLSANDKKQRYQKQGAMDG